MPRMEPAPEKTKTPRPFAWRAGRGEEESRVDSTPRWLGPDDVSVARGGPASAPTVLRHVVSITAVYLSSARDARDALEEAMMADPRLAAGLTPFYELLDAMVRRGDGQLARLQAEAGRLLGEM
jgi:hypothetical protein